MKKITILLLLVLLVQTSCDNIGKECGECMSPPPSFMFQFIDKDNGENLFTNRTFSIEDVKVTDEENNNIEFHLVTENGANMLDISIIGWNFDPKTYTIQLNDSKSVKLDLNMKEFQAECCIYIEVETFKIYDYEYERENQYGLIIVKM